MKDMQNTYKLIVTVPDVGKIFPLMRTHLSPSAEPLISFPTVPLYYCDNLRHIHCNRGKRQLFISNLGVVLKGNLYDTMQMCLVNLRFALCFISIVKSHLQNDCLPKSALCSCLFLMLLRKQGDH